MAGIVGIVAELGDTGVTPATDGLIGGQLVSIPHLTHVARGTAIDTVNVAITIGTTVTSDTDAGVALVEQLLGINRVGRNQIGVDRLDVQVVHTRRGSCSKQQQSSGNNMFEKLIHCRYYYFNV